MISIGGYRLPVPLYGSDHAEPNDPRGDWGCSTGPSTATEDRVEAPGDGDADSPEETAEHDDGGDSFTKVHHNGA
jgi:hypothetical protein